MIRIAIYARVSTADQDCGMQVTEMRQYIERRGWKLANEYVDEGISGTRSSRPELDRLMADARRRKFDLVLVWRFDRFARSTTHLLSALEEFRSLGIEFVSLHESIDTTTPLGKMVFTVVASVAELERAIITERVRAGVARARAKGKRLGRPPGSKIDATKVRVLLARGMSMSKAAMELGISIGSVHRVSQSFK